MITADTVIVQDNEPVAATVDQEVVMLSVRAGAYFGLNGVGSEIWNMDSKPCRVGDVLDALAQVYDVDAENLNRDVIPYLQALLDRGLLRLVKSGEGVR